MRVVIIGSNGRLGAALKRHYSQEHQVLGLGRAQLDLRHPDQVRKRLEQEDFDAIVNCAAVTSVDYCETHHEEAGSVNAYAAQAVAEVAAAKGARCIHISTDYVFGGTKTGPYREQDPAEPLGVYAETKLRGEKLVLAVSPAHCVVRVSWVFGPDRPSFIDMMLRRALQNDRVEAIADKISCPGYSLDYAEWLGALLFGPDEQWARAGGLLHLCNTGATNWRDYAEHALQCAMAAGLPLRTTRVEPLLLRDMAMFVAPRPVNTVMDTGKFTKITGITPRPWQAAVEDYVVNYVAKDPEMTKIGA